jgi:dolichyl-phosphate beta-glucosyltransferase
MGPLPRTLIVVPCFNEAARLDLAAFARGLTQQPGVAFVFVDDGSTDGTAAVIQRLAAEWADRVTLVRLERNSGKAEAVRRGVVHAATLQPAMIGYWDADLATPLEDIPMIAAALAETDVVLALGSRVRMLGRDIDRAMLRHYIGRAFATLASMQLRLPVYDTQCGAKIFRATPEAIALFTRPFRLRWCFDVELIARFLSLRGTRGARAFVEVPVTRWRDPGGSKLTWRQAARIIPEVWRLPAVIRDERRRGSAT